MFVLGVPVVVYRQQRATEAVSEDVEIPGYRVPGISCIEEKLQAKSMCSGSTKSWNR